MKSRLAALLIASGLNAAALADEVSFQKDIVPVLKTRCATCHLTGQEAGNMALHPRAAYANLVEVPSIEAADMLRVKPGEPNQSYLLRKLEGTHLDAGGSGVQMPLGQAPLDAAMLAKFRAWIEAGAADN